MKRWTPPRFDRATADSARWLIERALEEDLDVGVDLTSEGLLSPTAAGAAHFVPRADGRLCGLDVCRLIVEEYAQDVTLTTNCDDGRQIARGEVVAILSGPARQMLRIERTCLNFLGRLSGICTLTARFVQAVAGTQAQVLDTRKTTPGWRRLEKYAVRCGGGKNHRMGLFDAVLIKDNHLAFCQNDLDQPVGIDGAIRRMRAWLLLRSERGEGVPPAIEVEVDSLEQLRAAAAERPDIVLLDNMSPDQLRQCVGFRNEHAPGMLLEASGGVHLDTITEVAQTGVDRISVGALTHSAVNFDIGLDWSPLARGSGR